MRRPQEAPSSPTTRRLRRGGAQGRRGRSAEGRSGARRPARGGRRKKSSGIESVWAEGTPRRARAARTAAERNAATVGRDEDAPGSCGHEVVERLPLELDEDAVRGEEAGANAAPAARRAARAAGERAARRRRRQRGDDEKESRRRESAQELRIEAEQQIACREARERAREREVVRRSSLAHNPRPASLASFPMAVNESLRVLKTIHYDAALLPVPAAGDDRRRNETGHFAMIQAGDGLRPYLRRAFSIADVTTMSRAFPRMEFVVKIVGVGTAALARFAEGTPLPVLGPLGVPFPIDDLHQSDRVALVAGGIGLAPLVLLARHARPRAASRPTSSTGAGTRTTS